MGINFLSLFLFLFAKAYYVLKNRSRDGKWNAMTPEVCLYSVIVVEGSVFGVCLLMMRQERTDYTLNTTDKASRRLDFRFAS